MIPCPSTQTDGDSARWNALSFADAETMHPKYQKTGFECSVRMHPLTPPIHFMELIQYTPLPRNIVMQQVIGEVFIEQYGYNVLLLQIVRSTQEHRVQQNADKNAFAPIIGKTVVQLPGIDKYPVPRLQPDNSSVDIIHHMSRHNGNKLHIVMPVADCGIVRVSRQYAPPYVDRITRRIIMDFF